MKKFTMLLFLVALGGTRIASADVLVLVHGYLGSAQSWAESGVLDRLVRRGYRQTGIYWYSHDGVHLQRLGKSLPDKPVYAVNLPSQAPIVIQADWLAAFLRDIRKHHPDEAIALAAHSAGGVAARMALVRHGALGVNHLITIAAPHAGTGRALQALDVTDDGGPFGFVKSWLVRRKTGNALYATVRQSRGVLLDLAPPRPGNLLFWLNGQPHPDIRYTAIMRIGTVTMPGDQVVPPLSQDMNQVPALVGRAKTYSMAQGHLLSPRDGDLIGNLLAMPETGN